MSKPSAGSDGVVFLSPEAPYPLAGGGPVRSASLLEFLSRDLPVHLITFDDSSGLPLSELPQGVVDKLTVVDLPLHSRSKPARLCRNLRRLLQARLPLSDRFGCAAVRGQVERAVEGVRYRLAVVEHFWCASYLPLLRRAAGRVILNLHNVESALHESCARSEGGVKAAAHSVFRRIAERAERELLPAFDLILTASEQDRERVLRLAPSARVSVYPNAIPWAAQPGGAEEEVVAFSGNLEYHPNVTAVKYFLNEVWPSLKRRRPDLRWRLIGRNEAAARRLASGDPRIEFTGQVDNALAELARAKVVVVPLLAGSGTRIKILEAWAAGRAVVSTPVGAEGLPARHGENVWIAATAGQMTGAVCELLENAERRRRLGAAGRRTYEERFCWPAAWKTLEEPLQPLLPAPAAAAVQT